MNHQVSAIRARKLRQLAEQAASAKEAQDEKYFTTRTVRDDRDFLIACRHWNSSTPVIPRQISEPLPSALMAGYGFGGGYFLVLNGVGIVVDPGYGFTQVLYNFYGYTICDIDVVFVTHDHPDHWADLANILVLKHAAKRYPNTPSREPTFYLNRTVSELRHFLFPSGYPHNTIGRGQIVSIIRSDGKEAATVTGVRAFHCERLLPKSNSPNAIGLHFEIARLESDRPGLRNIAIAGDTQFPSVCKHKQGLCEFTAQDVQEFEQEYDAGKPGLAGIGEGPRGRRDIDVLALHIGSIEPQIGQMRPDQDALEFIRNEIFYEGYHLGFAGCLKMLDMVFRNDQANTLAILTEFGEELRGHRVDLATALEGATEANPHEEPNVRVLPADIGMALQLTWEVNSKLQEPMLRCSKCLHMREFGTLQDRETINVMGTEMRYKAGDKDRLPGRFEAFNPMMSKEFFHPVSEMQVFEDLDTGLIQYCCHW